MLAACLKFYFVAYIKLASIFPDGQFLGSEDRQQTYEVIGDKITNEPRALTWKLNSQGSDNKSKS